ncbi:MAG: hypothetical protein RL757_183 [Bacteroidota bacterium]|jgi:ABC-type multidrug transport system fused ATPase/permease subunit
MKETLDSQLFEKSSELSDAAKHDLKQAAMWARFTSIILYIFFGIIVLGILVTFFYLMNIGSAGLLLLRVIVVYIMFAIFIYHVAKNLYGFSNQTVQALMQNSGSRMDVAFLNLRLYLRLYGIASIGFLVFKFISYVW